MSDGMQSIDPEELLAHAGWVRALARSLLFDQQQVDDVVQQTWLVALGRPTARRGRLRPWLASIVRSQALHAGRADARRTRRERAAAAGEATRSTADLVAEAELHRRLVTAVIELDEPYRSTLLQHYFRDMSSAEIARAEGIPAATVRSRQRRGLEQLRVRLDDEFGGERRAWSLALVPLAASHAVVGDGAVSGAASTLTEVMTMGVKAKLWIGAAVAAVAIATLWTSGLREPDSRRDAPVAETEREQEQETRRAEDGVPGPPAAQVAKLATDDASLADEGPLAWSASAPSLVTGTLRVRVTWEESGRPAADIGLRSVSWEQVEFLYEAEEGSTGVDGTWVGAEMPTGRVTVYTDRAGSVSGEVHAGRTTELALAIPSGITVSGTVEDPQGEPVGGAAIWLSGYGNATSGRVVARADAEGRFELRSAGAHHHVGARADGFGPSALRALHPDEAPAFHVRLRLGPPGGSVVGVVLDAQRDPVAGATVLVGPEHGWPAPDPRNNLVWAGPPPLQLRTDGDGGFEVTDVPAGTTDVQVRATGMSPWRGDVTVLAGEAAECRVELLAGARLTGTVVDAGGRPLVGATVSAGRYGEMHSCSSMSGADGTYELQGLALGSTEVRVSLKGAGEDARTFQVGPGARLLWDPVLERGRLIVGRIVDDSGGPVEGLRVSAGRDVQGATIGADAPSDAVGRFTISNCEDAAYIVRVSPAFVPSPIPLASVRDVRPGGAELVITVPRDRRASAVVSGVLRDEAGLLAPDVMLSLQHLASDHGVLAKPDAVAGAFRFDPVVPGRYAVLVLAPGRPVQAVNELDLQAGEFRDLGVVALEQPAAIFLRILVPADVHAGPVSASVKRTDGPGFIGRMERLEDGRLLSPPLVSGRYEISVRAGHRVLEASHPVVLGVGERKELDITLERGVAWNLELELPPEPETTPELRISVLDGHDTEVVSKTLRVSDLPGSRRRAETRLSVRPGAYTVRAYLDGRLVLDEPVTLTDTASVEVESSFALN
jgi:RNA polymerase sigma-70 factor (ECF subfamily)